MFTVDGVTRTIKLSKGDTGGIKVWSDEYSFAETDRAVFTIRDRCGRVLIEKILVPYSGRFIAALYNQDTEGLPFGLYKWEVRIVIHPYYDADGNIENGDQIVSAAPMVLNLLPVLKKV